jgi:uncharacterized membrane protein
MAKSRASINGHPAHPALVAIPIGLLTGTVLSDIAYLFFQHNLGWLGMSFWTALAGIAFAIPAAITGLIDYSGIDDGYVKGIATKHMIMNSIAITIFGFTTALLIGGDGSITDLNAKIVIPLQIAAYAGLGLAGYLGGEMVFKHKMAVNEEDEPAVKHTSVK